MNRQTVISDVVMTGVAACVPPDISDNTEYEPLFGAENVQKFRGVTGVKTRHVARPEDSCSDFSCLAAKRLLAAKKTDIAEIDAIIFVSQTPDYVLPATACHLHRRLKAPHSVLAFDVNLGCSGFVYGCAVAASLLNMQGMKKVLLCGGDTSTKIIDRNDKGSAMLFGDGGFAALLEKSPGAAPWQCEWGTDGEGYDAIIIKKQRFRNSVGQPPEDAKLFMDGLRVFNFSIDEVPIAVKNVMAAAGVGRDDVDGLVMHQANLFILKQVAKLSGLRMDKVPVSIDRYGNTSVTSIPLTLCSEYSGRQEKLDLLLAGFGVGLSWGVIRMPLDPAAFLPVITFDRKELGDE